MKKSKIYFLITFVFMFIQCSKDDDSKYSVWDIGCNDADLEMLHGTWSNPRFISNYTNCDNECIEFSFIINPDFTYQINYKITDFDPPEPDIEFTDSGFYEVTCLDARTRDSPFGTYRLIDWDFVFMSDSLNQYQWFIHYNGIENMVIQPELLGLTGSAFVMLNKS